MLNLKGTTSKILLWLSAKIFHNLRVILSSRHLNALGYTKQEVFRDERVNTHKCGHFLQHDFSLPSRLAVSSWQRWSSVRESLVSTMQTQSSNMWVFQNILICSNWSTKPKPMLTFIEMWAVEILCVNCDGVFYFLYVGPLGCVHVCWRGDSARPEVSPQSSLADSNSSWRGPSIRRNPGCMSHNFAVYFKNKKSYWTQCNHFWNVPFAFIQSCLGLVLTGDASEKFLQNALRLNTSFFGPTNLHTALRWGTI